MKFCKDCKYFYAGYHGNYCNNTKNGLNPVTAGVKLRPASINRGNSLFFYKDDKCGEDAEWFEPKEVKALNWIHRLMFWRKD